MGMCIEVEGKTIYTVKLTDEDVLLVKQRRIIFRRCYFYT